MAFFNFVNGGVKQDGHHSGDHSYHCPNMRHCHPSSQPSPAARPEREIGLFFPDALLMDITDPQMSHMKACNDMSKYKCAIMEIMCYTNIYIK